jgi:hypothetical protein
MGNFQLESVDLDDFVSFLGGGEIVDAKARELKAFQRARAVKNPLDLVRLALMYGPGGQSLRGLAATASAAGIADLSDPALLKRLIASADLLEALCQDVLGRGARALCIAPDPAVARDTQNPTRTLRLVDGSRLEGPGDRCWRLHMAYDPVAARISEAKITTLEKGETLKRFQPQPNDIVIADRGFAQPDGLGSVEAGADAIVRVTWNSLKLTDPSGRPIDWLALCGDAREQGTLDIPVLVHKAHARFAPLALRLVMIRKSPEAAAKARDLAERASRKDQRKRVDPRTLEAADHIILVTSLDPRDFPAERVGMLYRLRWQIELAFKRLKSILHIDQLPAKSDALARTWLHAHLLLALYLERLQDVEASLPP